MAELERELCFNILQQRVVNEPWSLTITLKKHYTRIRADCSIIADWIPNLSHTYKLVNLSMKQHSNKTLIKAINQICKVYEHELNKDDIKQIEDELNFHKSQMSERKIK